MLLEAPLEKILKAIGHDGSAVIFPELSEPYCRRSFHIQEIIDIALISDYALVPLVAVPESGVVVNGKVHIRGFEVPYDKAKFESYLKRYNGILIGTGKSKRHAWAWYNGVPYDPTTGERDHMENITVEGLWALIPIRKL